MEGLLTKGTLTVCHFPALAGARQTSHLSCFRRQTCCRSDDRRRGMEACARSLRFS
jgi:hypothetical protein